MIQKDISINKINGEGWRGYYFLEDSGYVPNGGIEVESITHQAYHLAKKINVIKIWIDVGLTTEKSLTLGPNDFQPVQPKSSIVKVEKPPYPFGDYRPVQSITAVFISKAPVIPGGSFIQITQTFIFTNYSSAPAHEPSGNLAAARIFPLIKFEFLDDEKTPVEKRVQTVRVDYKIEYNLDLFLHGITIENSFKKSNAKDFPTQQDKEAMKNRPQQAGVFRDSNVLKARPTDTFVAAEKPLIYEIAGTGLIQGNNFESIEIATEKGKETVLKPLSWDNIHWWGGYKKSHIPSAPGAFHAAHLHWRWGQFIQEKFPLNLSAFENFGADQFKGVILGGALIDPNILFQTIKFVIAQSDLIHPNLEKENIEEDFVKQRMIPNKIKDGANIFLLLSCLAERTSKYDSFLGTFFIHGLFFAHDAEPTFLGSPISRTFLTGTQSEEYIPNKPDSNPPKWVRNPHDLI